jgi:hypothetical protein
MVVCGTHARADMLSRWTGGYSQPAANEAIEQEYIDKLGAP